MAEKWKNFDFDSKRVLKMAQALSPAYLRLGGTAADLLYFKEQQSKTATTNKVPQIRVPSKLNGRVDQLVSGHIFLLLVYHTFKI